MIVCEAKRGEIERRGVISGADVYGLTAAAVSLGAILAAGKGFEKRGALAPSQAFDPRSSSPSWSASTCTGRSRTARRSRSRRSGWRSDSEPGAAER